MNLPYRNTHPYVGFIDSHQHGESVIHLSHRILPSNTRPWETEGARTNQPTRSIYPFVTAKKRSGWGNN